MRCCHCWRTSSGRRGRGTGPYRGADPFRSRCPGEPRPPRRVPARRPYGRRARGERAGRATTGDADQGAADLGGVRGSRALTAVHLDALDALVGWHGQAGVDLPGGFCAKSDLAGWACIRPASHSPSCEESSLVRSGQRHRVGHRHRRPDPREDRPNWPADRRRLRRAGAAAGGRAQGRGDVHVRPRPGASPPVDHGVHGGQLLRQRPPPRPAWCASSRTSTATSPGSTC